MSLRSNLVTRRGVASFFVLRHHKRHFPFTMFLVYVILTESVGTLREEFS